MPRPTVVVLDYGSGNVRSGVRALERLGASVHLTAEAALAEAADGLVVPGVGAFAACMQGLEAVDGPRLISRRLAGGRPLLGICVGMQILFEHGIEHGIDTPGCGELPGTVERLDAAVLPHMGWNTVDAAPGSRLLRGVEGERFYFVHSYAVRRWESPIAAPGMRGPAVTWATYGVPFVAAVEYGPLAATQFHPEKSGDSGLELLRNWLRGL